MGKIRVMVASNYQIVRSALRQLLGADEGFDVLPTEVDIRESLAHACQTVSPDVLLLEISANGSSSLRVPANVLGLVPNTRIIVLSTNDNATYVRSMFAVGVLGYVLKAAAQSELFQAVKQVHRGRRFLDSRLRGAVTDLPPSSVRTATDQPCRKHLSRRETEVLRAIALGFTTKEISSDLDLSEKTVQTYRERICKKLGLRTRADLVHYAVAHRLAD